MLALSAGGAWAAGTLAVLTGAGRIGAPAPAGARVVLVLGCPPGARLAARVDTAVALRAFGRADRIVFSGAGEAEWGARRAAAAGVPAEAILVEPGARNTWENLRLSAELLGGGPVWLVSDRWHLPRAVLLAEAAGLHVAPVPAGWPGERPAPVGLAQAAREGLALVKAVAAGHLPPGVLIGAR